MGASGATVATIGPISISVMNSRSIVAALSWPATLCRSAASGPAPALGSGSGHVDHPRIRATTGPGHRAGTPGWDTDAHDRVFARPTPGHRPPTDLRVGGGVLGACPGRSHPQPRGVSRAGRPAPG